MDRKRIHILDGTECWCEPDLLERCRVCDGKQAGCFACSGTGLIPAHNYIGEVLVIHKDEFQLPSLN